MLNDDIVEFK